MKHNFYYFKDLNKEPEVLNLKFNIPAKNTESAVKTAVLNPDCFFKKTVILNKSIYKKITDKQDFFKDLFPVNQKIFSSPRICDFKLSGKAELKILVFCLKPVDIDLSSFNFIAPADLYFLNLKKNASFQNTSYVFQDNELADISFGDLFENVPFELKNFIKMFKSKKMGEENFICVKPPQTVKVPFWPSAAAVFLFLSLILINISGNKAVSSLREEKETLMEKHSLSRAAQKPVFNTLSLLSDLTSRKLEGIEISLLKIERNSFLIEGEAADLTTLENTAKALNARVASTNVLSSGIRFTMENEL